MTDASLSERVYDALMATGYRILADEYAAANMGVGWRVVNNVTGQPESKTYPTRDLAVSLCGSLNFRLGRNGGGLYGIEEVTRATK